MKILILIEQCNEKEIYGMPCVLLLQLQHSTVSHTVATLYGANESPLSKGLVKTTEH